MKKTKEFKPSYIVNLDDIDYLDEIPVVFALAKQNAGLALSDKELTDIIEFVLDEARPRIYICTCPKKEPWYKRFWNWITRKNK